MHTINQLIIRQLNRISYILLFILVLSFIGCQKFLDKRPIKDISVPTTLDNLQGLLDFENSVMNINSPAGIAELAADNYYVTTATWQSEVTSFPENASNYIWDPQAIPAGNAWNGPYTGSIYYSNVVLDQLPLVVTNPGEEGKRDMIKGAALFYRAFAFMGLAQVYCLPYSTANADKPGIVLKMSSNTTDKVNRATVQQTYDRIISDLKEAADLLPTTVPFPTRPNKAAAYGTLARTYLFMRDYVNAGNYANLALQQYSTLLDYNTRIPVGNPAIPSFNAEVIFNNLGTRPNLAVFVSNVDSTLYRSYNNNDLRRTVFYVSNGVGTFRFRGCYHGNNTSGGAFDGITTGELYLERAECAARNGLKDSAMADLNRLMIKRWSNTVPYPTFTATTATDALTQILTERRKELAFRGLRWSDIRRFNIADSSITLKRIVNGITYTLPPNDLRYALLIPYNEINRSGIQQNIR